MQKPNAPACSYLIASVTPDCEVTPPIRRNVCPGRIPTQGYGGNGATLRPGSVQTQVSRATKALDEELSAWRQRPLGEVPFLVLDARYEKVRHGGSVVSCAVLIAAGVAADGHCVLLGVSVSLSEAEVHWREFLASLQDRGLHGVQ